MGGGPSVRNKANSAWLRLSLAAIPEGTCGGDRRIVPLLYKRTQFAAGPRRLAAGSLYSRASRRSIILLFRRTVRARGRRLLRTWRAKQSQFGGTGTVNGCGARSYEGKEWIVPVKKQSQFPGRGGRDLPGDCGILSGCGRRGHLEMGVRPGAGVCDLNRREVERCFAEIF